jgi:hypothetical protein
VAGPRASKVPTAHAYAFDLVSRLLRRANVSNAVESRR